MINGRIKEGYGNEENLNHTKNRRTTICTQAVTSPSPKKRQHRHFAVLV